ncbi:hypothetical protein PR202_gb02882 [Eleusine coracana subsp. coracana]|uniref:Cyclin N-terminal domain-containing protein n=1 Tax=Eleusine coracana subsp. coracana TaxID=191504 RepID=A0AAV5DZV5_ELECO|nr:hypothetical protein QOZ80_8BG0663540 [Eleusine coracana subsp. coracana]GJN15935.1 hypothetical protein PR202_gb02882 [Eleusine coracana subsp. coracana]
MAPSCYDVAASMLLCAEDNSSILWLEEEEQQEEVVGRKRGGPGRSSPDWDDGFGGADLFPPQSEECVAGLVEREPEHMPRSDYGERLRRGGVDLCVRWEAVDWIWKVHAYYGFGPLTACLAVNYLDRFLSHYELPEGKAWMTQLLSVACLSLAAKMEETAVPQSLDLQVGDARYIFEAKTIQRMELLVLSTLNWRMQAVTPFSYLDYFLQKLNGGNAAPRSWLFQSAELILGSARGTGCIGFRPSEIAAAVAVTVVGDADAAGEIVKACAHVDKERVLRCQDAIQSMASSINTVPPKRAGGGRASPVPQSPVGVLDAGCMSYKSDDDAAAAVASHGASASASSVTSKRRKISR